MAVTLPPTARVAAADALRERYKHVVAETQADVEPYARDPFKALDEGLISVWDPTKMAFVPFKPWEHQRDLIREWMNLELLAEDGTLRFRNRLVEKSRQMGDTVICAYVFCWVVTYHDAPMLMQHQDLGDVDDGGAAATWDSFFGKIRLIHERWPAEIGRANLRFRGGSAPLIRNLDHAQRFIVGEGQTPNPGRGGRYAGALIDEAARIRYDKQGHSSLSQACPTGRLMLSTPYGEGNVYYRMRDKPPQGWKVRRHHWSDHPVYGRGKHVAGEQPESCALCRGTVEGVRYDASRPRSHRYPGKLTSPWYEKAIVELEDEQVAEELDIDYTGSLEGRVYKGFDQAVHVVDDVPYDPALPLEFSWDYGVAHPTAVGIWQDAPDSLRKIGEFEQTDLTPDQVAEGVRGVLRWLGVDELLLTREFTRQYLAVGDPAGEARSQSTGRPITADYRANGFSIVSQPEPVQRTIDAVKRLLRGIPKPVRYSALGCPKTIQHIKANKWPTNTQGQIKPGATAPLDDQHNHMMRADAYYVCWKYPPPRDEEQLEGPTEEWFEGPTVFTDVRPGDAL